MKNPSKHSNNLKKLIDELYKFSQDYFTNMTDVFEKSKDLRYLAKDAGLKM